MDFKFRAKIKSHLRIVPLMKKFLNESQTFDDRIFIGGKPFHQTTHKYYKKRMENRELKTANENKNDKKN